MDFEENVGVEEEVDSLGLTKKKDSDLGVDLPEDDVVDDTVVPPELEEETEPADEGIFGDDKEFENQILDPYGDRDEY